MSRRGRFITFEGPEGSGKTTQAARLVARLRETGREVVATREPGGTAVGERIRHLLQHDETGDGLVPEAEALLFAASRAQLVREVILPALGRGAVVVCDRFHDSTAAYQGFGRGFDLAAVDAVNAFAIGPAVPDLTLFLDLDLDLGFARMAGRGGSADRMEREARDFHARTQAGYRALAAREPDRFRTLDAAGDPDAVAEAVWREVARVLG